MGQSVVEAGAEAAERVSVLRILFDDFSTVTDEREANAAKERVHPLSALPLFLLGTHAIGATALALATGAAALSSPLLIGALAVLIGVDILLWVLAGRAMTRALPRTVVTLAAVRSVGNAALGALACAEAARLGAGGPLWGLAAALFLVVRPAVLIGFPGLVAIGSLAGVIGWGLVSRDAASTGAAALAALCLVRLSIAQSAERNRQLRRRAQLDWNAQRASRFIEEFEQAGRGWFWETSARGALSYVSDQLATDLATPASELIGKPFADLIGTDEEEKSKDASERTLGFHLTAKLPFNDITVRAASSKEIWWSLSGTPSFDEHGRFLGFRGVGNDLTEQRRSAQEINRLAKYDSLTGLPNRVLMRKTLDEALANKSYSGCALFLIDLDRFKNVNDTLGHPIGDALLKQVAQRLSSVIGSSGQVGRLGGDEFKAVLPSFGDESQLGQLAARLIQQLSMPYLIEGHNISIGASVGIAVAEEEGACGDRLIRDADLALYSAKAAGRGTFCFFAPEMHSEAQDRQMMENDLRRAIGRGELEVYYQPVVEAKSEALAGFEALIRWHHPTRGMISPALFIPLAEECGLILQVGEWVLRTACQQAAAWPENLRVAVNLSPVQFGDPSLPNTIVSALANSGLAPKRLELEITEGVFLVESESTDAMFAKLKGLGVRLALDDFGTGYSSLGYLRKTPFDKIKIDQSFVRGAAMKGSRNAAIIRAIVTLAESLDMDTTAEGAETHDELALIRDLGCSHIQGYIFGRPMPIGEANELAKQNEAVKAEGFQFNRPPRQGLLKVASLQWNGMTMPVRIRNISTGGAMVECERLLPFEAKVQLDLPGGGCVGGEVRWNEGMRHGIQFEKEFDLRLLTPGKGFGAKIARVAKPAPVSAPPPAVAAEKKAAKRSIRR
ncbi:MAG: putative bifunctional diguanylate cyclase/phosphodiesterase [Sphingosinicella sp.]